MIKHLLGLPFDIAKGLAKGCQLLANGGCAGSPLVAEHVQGQIEETLRRDQCLE